MTNVIDGVPKPHRDVLVAVLQERDPALLASLLEQAAPTMLMWWRVHDEMADAFGEHLGPGHEPTAEGVRIDNALGAFLTRWPRDRVGEAPDHPSSVD